MKEKNMRAIFQGDIIFQYQQTMSEGKNYYKPL